MAKSPAGRKNLRVISTILLFLIAFLTPVALYTNWASSTMGDRDKFVETFGELAANNEVQRALSSAVENLIDSVDVESAVEELLPPAFAPASGLIASGVKSGLANLGDRFIYSDQFSAAWTRVTEAFYTELIGALEGDGSGFVRDGDDGLFITVEPLREAVLERVADIPALSFVAPRIEDADLPKVQLMNEEQLRFVKFVWGTNKFVGVIIWPIIFLAAVGAALLRGSIWRGGMYVGISVIAGSLLTLMSVSLTQWRIQAQLAEGVFGRAISEIFDQLTVALQQSSYSALAVGITLLVIFGTGAYLTRFRPDFVEAMTGNVQGLWSETKTKAQNVGASDGSANPSAAKASPTATTAKKPAASKSKAQATTAPTKKPAAKKPAAKEPAQASAKKPAPKKPAAKKPAAKKPAAKKPPTTS
jgi:hypothetical protein